MFNNDFNTYFMSNYPRIENSDQVFPSLFESYDEHLDQSYHESLQENTRIVWVTNFINNDDFPIHVPTDDRFIHLNQRLLNPIEQNTIISKENDENKSVENYQHAIDLSKLNLDDLLLLLYQLQQKTTRNSIMLSNSVNSSSSNSLSSSSSHSNAHPSSSSHHSLTPRLSHAVQSFHPHIRSYSSLTFSNIADVPKQCMTTLIKPFSSFHSSHGKHLHSPNDVANQLLQSYHLEQFPKKIFSSTCTYQQSQQHKAKLISHLLSNKSYH